MTQSEQALPGITLRTLNAPLRALFTAFLLTIGIGYIAALTYMFFSEVRPHHEQGLGLVQGVTQKYRGTRDNTVLEVSLRGAMGAGLTALEKELMMRWVAEGSTPEGYKKISNIISEKCANCHNGIVPIVPMRTFEEVTKLTEVTPGPTWERLSRVSHIHLFGISFIFLLTGGIFALSATPLSVRVPILVLPYIAIWLDIGSWWVTHWESFFAYTVVIGGALMGMALGLQIVISLWEMWFGKRQTIATVVPHAA
jgi:hypothetical protein